MFLSISVLNFGELYWVSLIVTGLLWKYDQAIHLIYQVYICIIKSYDIESDGTIHRVKIHLSMNISLVQVRDPINLHILYETCTRFKLKNYFSNIFLMSSTNHFDIHWKKKWKTELISSNCDNVPRYLITIVSYIILRHEIVLVPTVAVDREGHVGHLRPRLLQG